LGHRGLGIEVDFSSEPTVGGSFCQAIEDLQLARACVVAPVVRRYPPAAKVDVTPVDEIEVDCRRE
jgi:hypothetical protein